MSSRKGDREERERGGREGKRKCMYINFYTSDVSRYAIPDE